MDIFPEIKGLLFKRQSACGAGPREVLTRRCVRCRHSDQVHPTPASGVLCCGDESRTMYRLVIKAFDHHIKPIKMLLISWTSADVIPECGRQTDLFPPTCVLWLWGVFRFGFVLVWVGEGYCLFAVFPQCFGDLLTNR